jgi:hypothetical protein
MFSQVSAVNFGVNFDGFGYTFKPYRADVIRHIPLSGYIHRFIPTLGRRRGDRICEISLSNRTSQPRDPHYSSNLSARPATPLDRLCQISVPPSIRQADDIHWLAVLTPSRN